MEQNYFLFLIDIPSCFYQMYSLFIPADYNVIQSKDIPGELRMPSRQHIFASSLHLFVEACQGAGTTSPFDKPFLLVNFPPG